MHMKQNPEIYSNLTAENNSNQMLLISFNWPSLQLLQTVQDLKNTVSFRINAAKNIQTKFGTQMVMVNTIKDNWSILSLTRIC